MYFYMGRTWKKLQKVVTDRKSWDDLVEDLQPNVGLEGKIRLSVLQLQCALRRASYRPSLHVIYPCRAADIMGLGAGLIPSIVYPQTGSKELHAFPQV